VIMVRGTQGQIGRGGIDTEVKKPKAGKKNESIGMMVNEAAGEIQDPLSHNHSLSLRLKLIENANDQHFSADQAFLLRKPHTEMVKEKGETADMPKARNTRMMDIPPTGLHEHAPLLDIEDIIDPSLQADGMTTITMRKINEIGERAVVTEGVGVSWRLQRRPERS
jgi:hypothetical protein